MPQSHDLCAVGLHDVYFAAGRGRVRQSRLSRAGRNRHDHAIRNRPAYRALLYSAVRRWLGAAAGGDYIFDLAGHRWKIAGRRGHGKRIVGFACSADDALERGDRRTRNRQNGQGIAELSTPYFRQRKFAGRRVGIGRAVYLVIGADPTAPPVARGDSLTCGSGPRTVKSRDGLLNAKQALLANVGVSVRGRQIFVSDRTALADVAQLDRGV